MCVYAVIGKELERKKPPFARISALQNRKDVGPFRRENHLRERDK